MSIHVTTDIEAFCEKCDTSLDELDRIYCATCAGMPATKDKSAVLRLVEKVRWIGDELRDQKVDWRIVDRVRELEADLLA